MPRSRWRYKLRVFRKNPFVDDGLELIAIFPICIYDSAGTVLDRYEKLFNSTSDGYEYVCSYWDKPVPKPVQSELPF